MDNYTRHLLLNELDKLASQIQIPVFRTKDYNWILRNILINNESNEKVEKVIKICQLLKTQERNNDV
jgi:hypothetical protein